MLNIECLPDEALAKAGPISNVEVEYSFSFILPRRLTAFGLKFTAIFPTAFYLSFFVLCIFLVNSLTG
jgi:hypothetical protein